MRELVTVGREVVVRDLTVAGLGAGGREVAGVASCVTAALVGGEVCRFLVVGTLRELDVFGRDVRKRDFELSRLGDARRE